MLVNNVLKVFVQALYKVPGTQAASYSLDLNDWTTGVGGTWLNWNVETGTFSELTAGEPTCQPLNIDTLHISDIYILNPVDKEIVFSKTCYGNIELFNQLGQRIKLIENFNDTKLNVGFLQTGTYFLRISDQEKSLVKKLIKK